MKWPELQHGPQTLALVYQGQLQCVSYVNAGLQTSCKISEMKCICKGEGPSIGYSRTNPHIKRCTGNLIMNLPEPSLRLPQMQQAGAYIYGRDKITLYSYMKCGYSPVFQWPEWWTMLPQSSKILRPIKRCRPLYTFTRAKITVIF